MTDGRTKFSKFKNKKGIQNFKTPHIIYLVHCDLGILDYTSQTTQFMRKRPLGHKAEILSGADGLGKHLLRHSQYSNLKDDKIFEEIMKQFQLKIIASVEPGKPWTQENLDGLEAKLQKNVMAMDYNGGIKG
jgi:hypothetical protein